MALFGAQRSNASPHLIEFKAGKLKYDEADKMVKPDPRKGVVYITQGEDGITHFCWKERQATSPEDELMVFPDDVEFLKVKKCTSGRVYVLRFKTSSRKLYFWLQEPNEEKDADIVKKVNDYVNGRNMPGTRGAGGRGGAGRSVLPAELQALGIDESNLHEYFGDVDQEQLGQLFSGGGAGNMALLSSLLGGQASVAPGGAAQQQPGAVGSRAARAATAAAGTPTTATALPAAGQTDSAKKPAGPAAASTAAGTGGSSGGAVQLADLQRALQGVTALSPAVRPSAAIDLSNTLTREALEPLLTNPEFVERLVQHLPDDPRVAKDKAELLETIQSPQFVSVAKSFSEAFSSGRLGAVVREFACPPAAVAAADSGNLQEFVRVMEEESAKKKKKGNDDAGGGSSGGGGGGASSTKPPSGGDKKDSSDMDLD